MFSSLLQTTICSDLEDIAVGILSECYQRDKVMAHKLLVRELETFGHTTLLTIADSAEQMEFMGHTCCQTKLNKIWKGKMALYTSVWKVGRVLTHLLQYYHIIACDIAIILRKKCLFNIS